MSPIIRTRELSRHFGSHVAVRGLNLEIPEGELFGFLGPNGAGKTTTIRMLCGLLAPTSGRLEIDGHDCVSDPQSVRQITGWVPDTPPLYEHLTGRQYITFVGSLYGVSRSESAKRAEPFLQSLGLADRLDELCRAYSHGMQKKIHLAAVLATRAKVLFLDEPTTGLDPRSARNLKDVLLESRKRGTTIFLSTHRLDTAEEICDRVGVIVDGELQAVDTLDRLRSEQGETNLEGIFLRLVEEANESRLADTASEES